MKTLLATIFILAISTTAWAGPPTLVSVNLFARFPAVIHDQAGREVTDITPPVTEYREIKKWDPHEIYTSPDKFDAVAIVAPPRDFEGKTVEVHFQLSAKVGPLESIEEGGPTDVEHGLRTAVWTEPEFTKTVKVRTLTTHGAIPVYLKNIDLKAIWTRYYNADKWPYFVKVTAWLSCDKCDSNKRLEAILQVMPGD